MNAAICAVCLKMYHQITLNERVCQGCLSDARLGRMVREIPVGAQLVHDADKKGRYWYLKGNVESRYAFSSTPEEALEKAMGEWK